MTPWGKRQTEKRAGSPHPSQCTSWRSNPVCPGHSFSWLLAYTGSKPGEGLSSQASYLMAALVKAFLCPSSLETFSGTRRMLTIRRAGQLASLRTSNPTSSSMAISLESDCN